MKILAIGCSFTFGSELPDLPPGPLIAKPPSQLAFPSQLGRMIDNAKVTNLGIPSGSNSRTFRLAIDQSAKEDYDLVICAWTDNSRADFRYEGQDLATTCNSSWAFAEFPWIEHYYKYHHDQEHSWQVWLSQVVALQNHFKLKNQKYVFLSLDKPLFGKADIRFSHLVKEVDPTNYLGWPKFGMTTWMGDCPKGSYGHPLELGHERIANKIYEHIRHLGWIS